MREELFQKVLAAAEREFSAFRNVISKYRFRLYRTVEHPVTEAELNELEKRIEEYRSLPESRGYFENRQAVLPGES